MTDSDEAQRPAADVALQAAVGAGVEICFANPGTTEMPLVAALDRVERLRPVLGLFEGVCTGAADGYARITRKPALTLLHLGPGFANGIANLHNARRAHSPVVNIIGDHASWHLRYDAPLTSDIVSLASPVSRWVRSVGSAERAASDLIDAIDASVADGGAGASLIYPVDFQTGRVASSEHGEWTRQARFDEVEDAVVETTVERLRRAEAPLFLLGGGALSPSGQSAAARLAEAHGGVCYAETFPALAARGGGLADIDRLPYFPEKAIATLDEADLVVLVGAREPVAYFGYEGIASELAPAGKLHRLSDVSQDGASALERVANALRLPAARSVTSADAAPEPGPLTPGRIGDAIASALPEDSIVSAEGASCSYALYTASSRAKRHRIMTNTGGALGQGLPCGLGAALAAPEQSVWCLQSDGSAQYTIQTLWTMVRENLPMVILIASNRRYAVLQTELRRIGVESFGRAATSLTNLSDPELDWVSLARGYGVSAESAETVEELLAAMDRAKQSQQPYLIEMRY